MSALDKPIGPNAREKTRDRLGLSGWITAFSGQDIVWRDREEKGTLWVETVDGVEYLVAGDADGMRVLQLPTALLINFVRLARLPNSGYVEPEGTTEPTGAELHEGGSCLHECSPSQRQGWLDRASEQQDIGRQLREENAPRSDCDGIDQEHGFDGGADS